MPCQTLRQLLVYPKGSIPTSKKTGVVYKIECGSYDKSYVGQTGQTIQHRFYTVLHKLCNALETNHGVDWSSAKAVDISDKGSI